MNRDTLATFGWIVHDEGRYRHWKQAAESAWLGLPGGPVASETKRGELADRMQSEIIGTGGPQAGRISASVGINPEVVDWDRLADWLLEFTTTGCKQPWRRRRGYVPAGKADAGE